MKNKLRQEKGITMMALVVTIIILLILTSVLVFNTQDSVYIKRLNNLYSDIELLRSKTDEYYNEYGQIPAKIKYTNIDTLKNVLSTKNDTGDFYVIDLEAMEGITLNYGKDYENVKNLPKNEETNANNYTDLYIINENSHNIFFVRGIEIKEKDTVKTYYTDYTEPEEYNVIVNHEKTREDDLTVTIRGGITDGSTLHFKIGEYGDTNCYIESVYFKDSQLYSKIEGVVTAKVAERNLKYHITVPLIINVDRDAISSIDELNLQHTDSSSDTKIKDLTGLENFGNLQTLYLQNK